MNTQPQFVDANIFIRHFTQDNPIQSPACTALFEQAEQNQMSLTTSEAIIRGLFNKRSTRRNMLTIS